MQAVYMKEQAAQNLHFKLGKKIGNTYKWNITQKKSGDKKSYCSEDRST